MICRAAALIIVGFWLTLGGHAPCAVTILVFASAIDQLTRECRDDEAGD